MTLINLVEYIMYGLVAFGIGAASYGIWSVVQAFSRKQYLLLDKRFDEKHDQFLQRKRRVDQALRKK